MMDMMKHCFGADGKPDFAKMMHFMDHHHRARKVDAIGWALFFIWVGIAWIANVGFGVGLLGVAAIILGMQAIRRLLGINVEFFWIAVGIGFGIGGLWEYLDVQTPLAPIVLIIAGIALLVSVTWFGRKHSHQHTHHQGKQE
jgi:hypothetical protein